MRAISALATLCLATLLACAAPDGSRTSAPALAEPLGVMTFNVRYGTADDGPDAWPARREHLLDVIRAAAPDVLGLQEALDFQVEWLEQRLPGYRRVGQGREGGARGEHAPLFVAAARLEIVEHGDFWLSERPDEVASVGWDAALTRICTWARLRERGRGRELTVWNTHFDHRGANARVHSAELVAERVARGSGPRIVMGDLNAGEGSAPLERLLAVGLHDSFRALHPDAREVGTYHAFRGGLAGEKIDHILATPDLEPLAAAILSAPGPDGRWPSDHHAVTATFGWSEPPHGRAR